MAACHDQPPSSSTSSNNHALIWLPEHLLLSLTGMKTYRPVSLRWHVGQHTTKCLPRSSRLSLPLLPGLPSAQNSIITATFPSWRAAC